MKKLLVVLIFSVSSVMLQQAAVVPVSGAVANQVAISAIPNFKYRLPWGTGSSVAEIENPVDVASRVHVNPDRLVEIAGQSVAQPRKKMWYEPGYGFVKSNVVQDDWADNGMVDDLYDTQSDGMFRPTRIKLNPYKYKEMSYSEALDFFGLQDGFTLQELKKTYKKMVQMHHPDVGGNTEMMKQVAQAYEVLKKGASSSYQSSSRSGSQDDQEWQRAKNEKQKDDEDKNWEEKQREQQRRWHEENNEQNTKSQEDANHGRSENNDYKSSYWEYAERVMKNAGQSLNNARDFVKNAWNSGVSGDKAAIAGGAAAVVGGGIATTDTARFKYKYPRGTLFVMHNKSELDANGRVKLQRKPSERIIWSHLNKVSDGKITSKTHKLVEVSRKYKRFYTDDHGNMYLKPQDSNDFNIVVEPR